MKPHKFTGICFIVWLLLFIVGCSARNSTMAGFQNAAVSNQNPNVPSMSKVDRLTPNLNGRVYKSKTLILNKEISKKLNCNNENSYSLVEVENYQEEESITSRDLNIVIASEVMTKIELPTGSEVKNFSLNSTKKTKNGFEMNTEWGGGLYHYEIQFDFRCKENNFYLYKVKKESFSTTNPNSGNFWDKKQTKITKIEPNLPIEKFVMDDYLQ